VKGYPPLGVPGGINPPLEWGFRGVIPPG
jgi:hypothetical protein